MNQYVKKLIASILFVFPLLMVTSVFADVEKTSESTQSENQSFDKTTFSEESITSETTESQSEAPTSNTSAVYRRCMTYSVRPVVDPDVKDDYEKYLPQ